MHTFHVSSTYLSLIPVDGNNNAKGLPDAADAESPLKPAELQVLRAQYEKEGESVGVQTKINYAWVRFRRIHIHLELSRSAYMVLMGTS